MSNHPSAVCIWGDSIAKGVVWNENRNRYAICPDNCVKQLTRSSQIPVVNHAMMGWTTTKCLSALDQEDLIPGGVAVLEFGGNDSDMCWEKVAETPDEEHIPQTPLPQFKENLKHLIQFFRNGGMRPVLVTPPPIDSEKYCHWVSKGLDADRIMEYLGDAHQMYRWQEQYAYAVEEIGYEENVTVFDLRGAFLKNRNFYRMFCKDGIHPNESGHHLMLDAIRKFISDEGMNSVFAVS